MPRSGEMATSRRKRAGGSQGKGKENGPQRRALEALGALLVFASLYAFYRSMTMLDGQDYVAGLLVAVVGIALMRSGVELARSALCD